LHDEVLSSEEESEESDEDETANNSDSNHEVASESTDKSRKTNGTNFIETSESFIDQKNNFTGLLHKSTRVFTRQWCTDITRK